MPSETVKDSVEREKRAGDALSPFNYWGLKLGMAGWGIFMLGAVLIVFLRAGWPAAIVVAVGFALMATGMILHWREFLRQDREWQAYHRQQRG